MPRIAPTRYLLAAALVCAFSALMPRSGAAQAALVAVTAVSALGIGVYCLARKGRAASNGWRTLFAGAGLGAVTHIAVVLIGAQHGSASGAATIERIAFAPVNILLAVGLLMLVVEQRQKLDRTALVDAALAAVAFGAASWVALVQPYASRGSLARATRVATGAFPVLDIVLVVALVLLVRAPLMAKTPKALLSIAVGVQLVTNSVYVLTAARGTFAYGSPVFAGHVLFYAAIAAAAWAAVGDAPSDALARTVHRPLGFATVGVLTAVAAAAGVAALVATLRAEQYTAVPVGVASMVIGALLVARLWQLRAAEDSLVSSLEAESADLRLAHGALATAHLEASDALRTKTEFLLGMNRQIAEPINGVLRATDLLLETDLNLRQRAYAETLLTSGDSLLLLINNLLGVSQLSVRHPVLNEVDFEVRLVANDVADAFSDAAAEKGLELLVAIDETVPERLHGDAERLAQVMTAYVDNAVKFTASGKVMVGASMVETRDDGSLLVRFGIHDTGSGLTAEERTGIFEPDVQIDASERRFRGTPRGLSVAAGIVDLLGGTVGVESEYGKGASFWFTAHLHAAVAEPVRSPEPAVEETEGAFGDEVSPPVDAEREDDPVLDAEPVFVVEAEPEAEAAFDASPVAAPLEVVAALASWTEVTDAPPVDEIVPEPDSDAAPNGPSLVVKPIPMRGLLLLAEDDPLNRRVTLAMLKKTGYRVDVVTNGVDAVRAVSARRYDAVLMDVQMPRMNGLEATIEIRSKEDAGRHLPVIALTAGTRDEDRDEAFDAGMDDFLAKPVMTAQLLETLARWVSRSNVKTGATRR